MCMHIDSTRKDIFRLCIKYRIALHCSKGTWRTNCDKLLTLNENITLKIIGRCNDATVSNNCTHLQAPPTEPNLCTCSRNLKQITSIVTEHIRANAEKEAS